MWNTKRKFDQVDDGSNDNHCHKKSGQNVLDSEDDTTPAQEESSNGHNNETNNTGAATDNNPDKLVHETTLENSTNSNSSEALSTALIVREPEQNENNEVAPAKKTRKRRRKGEPEPDHTATVVEKTKKMKRVPQACDRCHVRRFKCDNGPNGCYKCLNSGYTCIVTDRNTNKPRIRGGEEGVVVNFDEVQHENEELKAKNQELNQKIEELQNEIESLRGQVQYYQNFISSMGATRAPNYTPVSIPNGVYLNPRTIHPPHATLTHTQPLAPNYNNMNSNAFSGNMSIHYPPNMPNMHHGNIMPNAPPYAQWPQPNIHQGFPVASQPHFMTQAYNPYFSQVQLSPRSAQGRIMPAQNSTHGQGMGYQSVQMPNFQPQWWQARSPHNLHMPQHLGDKAVNVPNQHIPNQVPQNLNHQIRHPEYTGTATHTGADTQNQSSHGLKGLGIYYPTAQAHQGMGGISNQHIHNHYNSQMIPSQHLGHQAQGTNTQTQGMRPTNVSREGQYQDPNIPAHNADTQNQNNQHPIVQIQDNHHQNLPAPQQSPSNPNPQSENTNTAQEFEQEQLPPSLELVEPTLPSTTSNPNPEQTVNPDLILPETGSSYFPTFDEGGNFDFQNDNCFDIDTQLYHALMNFRDGSTAGPEALSLDLPTTNTTEAQIDITNNQQNGGANDDTQSQEQIEVQRQGQEQVQKLKPEQNIKKQTDQVKHEGNAEDLDDGLFAFSDI